jgi:hypothetical protein
VGGFYFTAFDSGNSQIMIYLNCIIFIEFSRHGLSTGKMKNVHSLFENSRIRKKIKKNKKMDVQFVLR